MKLKRPLKLSGKVISHKARAVQSLNSRLEGKAMDPEGFLTVSGPLKNLSAEDRAILNVYKEKVQKQLV